MTDQKPESKEEDKSIDTLLKEYAGDVKERDLDAFLNEETDTDFAADDEDEEVAPAQKKSGGMMSLFVSVLLLGAGTAAAMVYMNQNGGFQAVLGKLPLLSSATGNTDTAMQNTMGFEPSQPANDTAQPVAAEAAPEPAPVDPMAATPTTPVDQTAPLAETPAPALSDIAGAPVAQPAPIENQVDASAMTASEASDLEVAAQTVDTPAQTPDTAAAQPATSETSATPAPQTSAFTDAASATPEPSVTPAPTAPVAPVEAVKAEQPASPPATDVGSAVDTWASSTADNLNNAQLDKPAVTKTEPEKRTEPSLTAPDTVNMAEAPVVAPAPKKERVVKPARPRDPSDAALLPPYLAIQARKAAGGAAPVADTSATRQAPMMTGEGATTPAAPSVPVTTATPAPAGSTPMLTAATPEPETTKARVANTPLALDTRRSLPEVLDEAPAMAQASAPAKTSTPLATPERTAATPMKAPDDTKMPAMPTAKVSATPMASSKSPAPAPTAVPAATRNAGLAQSLLAQGDAAAKAGKTDEAVDLYQKALEADAVSGQGKSIDRGAVYDRIGAVLAGG